MRERLGGTEPRAGGGGGAGSGGAARRCHWARRRRGGVPSRNPYREPSRSQWGRGPTCGGGAVAEDDGRARRSRSSDCGRGARALAVAGAGGGARTVDCCCISLRGIHPKRNLRGQRDTREADMHVQVCEHHQQVDQCHLELSARRDRYYHVGQGFPGDDPPFKNRIRWAGDLSKKDASINIENMQSIHNGTYICDVKNPPDIVTKPGHIRLYVVEKEALPMFPVWVVVGIVSAVVVGLTLLISMILAVLHRRKNSKRDYTGCSTSESASPVKQAPRKSPSDTEGLVKSVPSGSHQGPVIYAQLDHSGGHHSDKINKSEYVVYADIRKN